MKSTPFESELIFEFANLLRELKSLVGGFLLKSALLSIVRSDVGIAKTLAEGLENTILNLADCSLEVFNLLLNTCERP